MSFFPFFLLNFSVFPFFLFLYSFLITLSLFSFPFFFFLFSFHFFSLFFPLFFRFGFFFSLFFSRYFLIFLFLFLFSSFNFFLSFWLKPSFPGSLTNPFDCCSPGSKMTERNQNPSLVWVGRLGFKAFELRGISDFQGQSSQCVPVWIELQVEFPRWICMDLTFPLPSQTEPSFHGEGSKEHLPRDHCSGSSGADPGRAGLSGAPNRRQPAFKNGL